MAEKQKTELNEEQILAFLQDIVGKIQTEEDPLELNLYRRLFKKAVPFHLRSYFAAYLLKQINTGRVPGKIGLSSRSDRNDRNGKSGRRDRNERSDRSDRSDRTDRPERNDRSDRNEKVDRSDRNDRTNRQEVRARDTRPEELKRTKSVENRVTEQIKSEPRPVLADDVSTTLFISIGRNRRVYPRDLIGLLMQNAEMDREHIGDIRVLDNYSFVQVITEDAEKIITALNEFEYRGRKLAVSYSRKKEESAEASDSDLSDSGSPDFDSSAYQDESDLSDDEMLSEGDALSEDEVLPEDEVSGNLWKAEPDFPDDEENNGNI